MFDLNGKVAIVTGASGGIGRSMAIGLSEQGADVAIFDVKDGSDVASEIETKSEFYQVDVTNEESVEDAVSSVVDEFGKIDILINNAGVHFSKPMVDTDLSEWKNLMEINVDGYFIVSKKVYPNMNEDSRIINIASIAGHHAFFNSAAYNSSKGAVIQLTKSMAMEFADKANVNVVCPGVFVTPMTEDMVKTDEMMALIESSVIKKRTADADEIKGLAVYLASDECSYMTGSVITIDGGWTCHL